MRSKYLVHKQTWTLNIFLSYMSDSRDERNIQIWIGLYCLFFVVVINVIWAHRPSNIRQYPTRLSKDNAREFQKNPVSLVFF